LLSVGFNIKRVLSPNIAPPVFSEEGSISIIPTDFFFFLIYDTSLLINEDLPTPGEPVMPITWAFGSE